MEATQQALSVVFVLCLLGAVVCFLRGRSPLTLPFRTNGKPRALESIDRLPLTAQHSLHLVRLGGKEVLIATHPHGCTLISEAAATQKAMQA